MTQSGGRLPVIPDSKKPHNKVYYSYPFQETLNYANVCVFELNYGDPDFLTSFDKNKLKFCSPIKRERENGGRIKLLEGHSYIIVPSTEKAGQTGEFFLSIYIDNDLKDVDITRVYPDGQQVQKGEEILPRFIREEAEKQFSVPSWKLALTSRMLKYMMGKEDVEIEDSSSDA